MVNLYLLLMLLSARVEVLTEANRQAVAMIRDQDGKLKEAQHG